MLRVSVASVSLLVISAVGSPVVDVVGLGSVQGVFLVGENESANPSNISAFLGIPYAKSPTGDLRWRSPETHESWVSKPLDGTKFGNCCMQQWPSYLPANKSALSEDCLSLNVYAPSAALNGKQKLPVMFWIHGGAYITGCSADYPGTGMVDLSNLKVLMVTINYRLNVFGFLGSSELKSRTMDGSFGNYGIQDQRFAMQWVADHIGSFSGDASDVTIFGESAGGSSIINHLSQTASFPFYKKAIVESGTYQGAIASTESEARYAKLKRQTWCKDVACLLHVTAEELQKLTPETDIDWGPTVDGVSLSDLPWNLIRRGDYNNKVPIMLGSNRDESAMFVLFPPLNKLFPPNMGDMELDAFLASHVGLEHVQEIRELYDPSRYTYPSDLGNYSQSWWTAMRTMTDQVPGLGACGARNFSQNLHKFGTPAVFTYLFAHPTQKGSLPGTGPGSVLVPHGSEIVFVLGGKSGLTPGEEYELSQRMSRYWSNFAINGDPNSDSLPKWPKYGEKGDVVQQLQTASEGGIVEQHNVRKAACDYWDSHSKKMPSELVFGLRRTVGPMATFV